MFENIDFAMLWDCATRRWSPQIGDPTVAGWATVGSYVLCAVLAVLVLRRRQKPAERVFWLVLLVLMVLLGINKQLDLQSFLTATGRCMARAQGWYAERRGFQAHFIEVLMIVIAAMLAFGLWVMRRHLRRNGLALLGLAVVAGFVAVRAIGFHHFDAFINNRAMLNLRNNVVLENAGLLLIAANALLLLRRPGR